MTAQTFEDDIGLETGPSISPLKPGMTLKPQAAADTRRPAGEVFDIAANEVHIGIVRSCEVGLESISRCRVIAEHAPPVIAGIITAVAGVQMDVPRHSVQGFTRTGKEAIAAPEDLRWAVVRVHEMAGRAAAHHVLHRVGEQNGGWATVEGRPVALEVQVCDAAVIDSPRARHVERVQRRPATQDGKAL